MDYTTILREIEREIAAMPAEGRVADYIPELAKVNPDKFGMSIQCLDGTSASVGDAHERFSIQSIAKVFALALSVPVAHGDIWRRIGVEPSGNAFNSLVQLEYERGVPRNPLINPGALVVSDILCSRLDDPKAELLAFVRRISGVNDIAFDSVVAESERAHGFRNVALANLLKAFGNMENDVDVVLDFYFHLCSIEMSCAELARAFVGFANHGVLPETGEEILTRSQAKRIHALMQTCGFYDEAGEFSFRVGLPGKSGVGGGIVAIHPRHYSVAVWSPRLDEKGNSNLGSKALELLTSKTGLSIF